MNPQSDDVSEPWESLDVSDSDIPFLRPCSTRLRHSPTASPPPPIPGPAGALQAAMRRRAQKSPPSAGREEDPVSTQEFVRRVIEDGGDHGRDGDFSAIPWQCAMELYETLRGHGNSTVPRTPLSSIRNGIHGDRVALVVAIVKSCTPTGLGDLMVILKDPSGTLGASIHRKVVLEGDYGKSISVGAVLVLQKVAVFAPSRSAYYLNVTLSNVVQIISKDGGLSSEKKDSPSSFRYALEGSMSSTLTHLPQAMGKSSESRESVNSNRVTVALPAVCSTPTHLPQAMGKSSESRESAYSNRVTVALPESITATRIPLAMGKSSESRGSAYSNRITVALPGMESNNSRSNCVNEEDASPCIIGAVDRTSSPIPETSFGAKKQKVMVVSREPAPDWTDEQVDMLATEDD